MSVAELATQRDFWLLAGLILIWAIYHKVEAELASVERFFREIPEARQLYALWKRRVR